MERSAKLVVWMEIRGHVLVCLSFLTFELSTAGVDSFYVNLTASTRSFVRRCSTSCSCACFSN